MKFNPSQNHLTLNPSKNQHLPNNFSNKDNLAKPNPNPLLT